MHQLTTAFTIMITIAAYFIGRQVFVRFHHPLANVVLVSTALVISVLLAAGIPHADYVPGMEIMTYLLGPATVALAVPVYKNRLLLKKYAGPIVAGVVSGSLLSITTAMLIVKLGGLNATVIASIAPKSATIPFAVEVAGMTGGDPSLAAAFVVATGTFGSIFGLTLLTGLKISNPAIRGLAMGTVSHGQGVAMALTEGEQQGSMAGVAMALTGIFTAIAAPFLIPFFL
ncbi:LrgB family protein|uniref:TIGR00659 family protein n=1 Tax=Dendrosporobacter quercicolus TaxID=146817 RepID=A0A1G9TYE9_9FIRM|nr:LrgB family protein [Dendrosporobacter quercicolus]NSL48813.1 LrgB family protein [Dendrosporobacter quercicolus DSM 1736]SDM52712.1 TIGR00659 family protein [Dendrosporobacter quercicolus]